MQIYDSYLKKSGRGRTTKKAVSRTCGPVAGHKNMSLELLCEEGQYMVAYGSLEKNRLLYADERGIFEVLDKNSCLSRTKNIFYLYMYFPGCICTCMFVYVFTCVCIYYVCTYACMYIVQHLCALSADVRRGD